MTMRELLINVSLDSIKKVQTDCTRFRNNKWASKAKQLNDLPVNTKT